MPRRTFAIGDIHGCLAALDGLLDLIGPTEDDRIITLGDYVDRGPDSRGVIERLIQLSRCCELIPILGNHDFMFAELARSPELPKTRLKSWLGFGGDATLASYGANAQVSDIPDEHLKFIAGCRRLHEDEGFFFTHANYSPEIPLGDQPAVLTLWEKLEPKSPPSPHVSGKVAVVGHTSQKSGRILDLGHLICIDTFCYGGQRLTAIELPSREVLQVDPLGLRVSPPRPGPKV